MARKWVIHLNKQDQKKDQLTNKLEALRQLVLKHNLVFENTNDLISVQKLNDLTYEYVNPPTLKVLGYSEEELLGKSAIEFMHPDDIVRVKKTIKENIIKGDGSAEFRYRKKDGSYIWLGVTAKLIHNKNNNASIAVISKDITERKDSEEALQKAYYELEIKVQERTAQLKNINEELQNEIMQRKGVEESLRKEYQFNSAILNTSDALIMVSTPEGRIVSFNTACEQASGYLFKEIMDKYPWDVFINGEDVKPVKEKYKKLGTGAQQQNTGENYWLTKAGQKRLFRWTNTALLDKEGSLEYIVSSGIDITEQHEAEEALKESESYYRAIFNNTGTPAVIIEEDMTISMANSYWEGVLGYKNEELVGANWTAFIPADTIDKTIQYHRLRRTDSTAVPLRYKSRIKDKQGKVRNGLINVDIIPGTNKSVATFIDLSEFNRINRALKATSAGNMALIHAKDEQDLLENVCKQIVEVGGYRFAWVGYLQKDEQQTVRPVAHAGYEEGDLKDVDIALADPERGIGPVGTAIKTGKTFICRNITTDRNFIPLREEVLRRGYKSMISIPLNTNGGRTFGALNIYSEEEDVFDKEEEQLLADMAGDLAYGITSLRARCERNLNAQNLEISLEKMQRILNQTVGSLATAVEIRDPYTAGHQRKVADLATAIAKEIGLSKDQIEGISVAGNLHDIGKINVPSEILSKPGKLSEIEFIIIKTHCQAGYEIIKEIEFPWPVADILLQHHERINGSGYPGGLSGEKIMFEARILAVADVIDAMASHRPYRPSLGIDAALEEVSQNKGILYDPVVVDACLKLFMEKDISFNIYPAYGAHYNQGVN